MADLADWRSVYLLSAGLTLLMAILLWSVLPRTEQPQATGTYGALIRLVFSLFKEEKVLRDRAVLAMLIFAAGTVLWTPLVLPLSAPPLSLSHTQIGLFGLAGALGAAHAGRLADKGFAQWVSATAMYAWAGWIGLCGLGAAINLLALIYWLATLPPKPVSVFTAGHALQHAVTANQPMEQRRRQVQQHGEE